MAGRTLTLKKFFQLSREEQNKRYKELSPRDQFGARQADVSEKEDFIPCNYCVHYQGFAKCKAYPERIPKEIMDSVINNNNFACSETVHYEYLGHKWNAKK